MIRIAALASLALLAACADPDGYADYGPSYGYGAPSYGGYGGYAYRPAPPPPPYWGPSYGYAPPPHGNPGWRGRDYGERDQSPFHQGNTSRDPGFRAPSLPPARMAPPPMTRGPFVPGTGPSNPPRQEQGAD